MQHILSRPHGLDSLLFAGVPNVSAILEHIIVGSQTQVVLNLDSVLWDFALTTGYIDAPHVAPGARPPDALKQGLQQGLVAEVLDQLVGIIKPYVDAGCLVHLYKSKTLPVQLLAHQRNLLYLHTWIRAHTSASDSPPKNKYCVDAYNIVFNAPLHDALMAAVAQQHKGVCGTALSEPGELFTWMRAHATPLLVGFDNAILLDLIRDPALHHVAIRQPWWAHHVGVARVSLCSTSLIGHTTLPGPRHLVALAALCGFTPYLPPAAPFVPSPQGWLSMIKAVDACRSQGLFANDDDLKWRDNIRSFILWMSSSENALMLESVGSWSVDRPLGPLGPPGPSAILAAQVALANRDNQVVVEPHTLMREGSPQWKSTYYRKLIGLENCDVERLTTTYMDVFEWLMTGSKDEEPNQWWYPYGYGPCPSDIAAFAVSRGPASHLLTSMQPPDLPLEARLCIIRPPKMTTVTIVQSNGVTLQAPGCLDQTDPQGDMHTRLSSHLELGCVHLFPHQCSLSTFLRESSWTCVPKIPPIDHACASEVLTALGHLPQTHTQTSS